MPTKNRGRKSNIKNSLAIKSKKVSTPWLKNALKSIGSSSMEVFKDISPNIYDITTSSTKGIQDLAKSVRSNGKNTILTTAIKNNKYIKAVGDTLQYAIEDIKSGNFNNEDRLSEKMAQQFMGEGWDDFDPDTMFSDWDDESDSSTNVQFNNFSYPDSGMSIAIDEGFRSSTEANLKGHKANIDTMVAISSAQMLQQQELNNQIISHLGNISNTMASIAEFNNSTMTSFIETATAFMESMGKKDDPDYSYGSDKTDPYSVYRGNNGGINVGNYKKLVMENIKSTFKNSQVGILNDMLSDNMDLLISNPMGALTKLAISQITPKTLKKSMQQLDEAVAGFIPTVLARIAEEGDGFSYGFKDGIVKTLAKVFGVKIKRTKEFDLENKITDKEATFDQITRHSIIEVIPKHLREQSAYLKAIAEQMGVDTRRAEDDSKVFNFQEGRYRRLKDIKESIYDDIRGSVTYRMSSSKFGNKMQEFMPTGNQKDTDTYTNMLDDLYLALERHGKFIDPTNMKKNSQMDRIIESLDYNANSKNYLRSALKNALKNPDTALNVNAAIQQAVNARNNSIKQMVDDPTAYNLWALDLDKTVDSGMREFYSGLKNRKNSVTKQTTSKSKGLGNVGDILNDIRFLLNRGINVHVLKGLPFEDLDKSRSRTARIAARAEQKQQKAVEKAIKRRERKMRRRGELGESESELSMFDEKEKTPDQWDEFMNGESFSFYRQEDEPEHQIVTRIKNAMQALAFGNGAEMFAQLTMILGDKVSELGKMLDEQFWTPMKNSLFGQKDDKGYSHDGLFSGFQNKVLDTYKKFSREFTGKGYTDSTGKKVEDKKEGEESVVGNLKKFAREIKNDVGDFILGERLYDEKTGEYLGRDRKKGNWLGKAIGSLQDGFEGWKTALFGEDAEKETKLSLADIRDKISDALPATITGGIGGLAFGAMSGGSLLGTLIGGPVGGAILGGIGGILSRSEKFKTWLFGDEDEDNGLISKKVQDFFKENKVPIIGGAVLGTAKSMLFGGGLLGSIVGGPIAGAMAGAGVALAKRSKLMQKFLYGDEDEGGWHKGVVNMFNNIFKKGDGSDEVSGGKLLGMGAIGAAGGALTAALVGKMGLIGAAMTPFGPIGGALAGLALSMKASKNGFHEFLFGKEYIDENGNKAKKAGILQKFGNMLEVELFYPMKAGLKTFWIDTKDFIIDKIMAPVEFALEPLAQGFKNVVDGIREKITGMLDAAGKFIKDNAIDPIVDTVKNFIVRPITKIFGFLFKGITGIAKTIIAAPFQGLALATNFMDARNKKNSREQVMEENRSRGFSGFLDNMKIRFNYGNAREDANYKHLGYDDREDRMARYQEERDARLARHKEEKKRIRESVYNRRLISDATDHQLTEDTEENRILAQQYYEAKHPYKLFGRNLKFKGDPTAATKAKPASNAEVLRDADSPDASTENRILGQNLKIVKLLGGISDVLHGRKRGTKNQSSNNDSNDNDGRDLMDLLSDIPEDIMGGNLSEGLKNAKGNGSFSPMALLQLFGPKKDDENELDTGDVDDLPHFAKGGKSQGGAAVVGEEGPELAFLPNGTNIIPNHKSIKVAITDVFGAAKNFFTRQTDEIADAVENQPDDGGSSDNKVVGIDIDRKNRDAYDSYKKKGSYDEQDKARKAKKKEEKEEEYRNHIAASLDNVRDNHLKFKEMWASIFSKKGIITGALILMLPLLYKFFKNGLPSIISNISGFIGDHLNQFNNDLDFGKHNLTNDQTSQERLDDNVNDFKNLLKTGNLGEWIMPGGEIDSMSGAKGNIALQIGTRLFKGGLNAFQKWSPIESAKNIFQAGKDLIGVGKGAVKGTFNLGKDVLWGLGDFLGDVGKSGLKKGGKLGKGAIDPVLGAGKSTKNFFGNLISGTKNTGMKLFNGLDNATAYVDDFFKLGKEMGGSSNLLSMIRDLRKAGGTGNPMEMVSEIYGFDLNGGKNNGLLRKGGRKVKELGKAGVDNAVESIKGFIDRIGGYVDDALQKVSGLADNLVNKVSGLFDNAATFIGNGVHKMSGMLDKGISKVTGFADNALQWAKNGAGSIIDPIKNTAGNWLDNAATFVGNSTHKVSGFVDDAISMGSKGISKVTGFADNIISGVSNSGVGQAVGLGADIVGETVSSAVGKGKWLVGKGVDKVKGLLPKGGFKNVLSNSTSVMDDVAKAGAGASSSVIGALGKLFKRVTDVVTKFGGKASSLSQFLGKVTKAISGAAGRLGSRVGALAKSVGSGLKTGAKALGAIISPVMLTLGAINGASGAARLFRVDKSYVDGWMTAISTAIGAFSQSMVGGLLDIANELITDIMGVDLYHELATIAYHAIAGEQKYQKLLSGKDEFEGKYEDYKYETYLESKGLSKDDLSKEQFMEMDAAGEIDVDVDSFATWNDKQNQTLGSKAMQAVNKVWKGTEGVRNKIVGGAKAIGSKIVGGAKKAWGKAKEIGGNIKDGAIELYEKGVEKVKGILKSIGSFLQPFTDVITGIGDKIFGKGEDGSTFIDRCMKTAKSFMQNSGQMFNFFMNGDLKGLMTYDAKIDEGTPMAPIINILNFAEKIIGVIPTAVTWIGKKIFGLFNKNKGAEPKEANQMDMSVGTLFKNALKGNLDGVSSFKVSVPDESSPTAGITKALLISGKVIAYPIALVSKAGQSICSIIGKAVTGIGEFLVPTVKNIGGLLVKAIAGDIEGVHSFEIDVPEGTPAGGFVKVASYIVKILGYPIAAVSKLGQNLALDIYDFVANSGAIFSVVGENASKYFSMAKDGSIIDAIKEPIEIPEGTPLGGFTTFLTHVAKFLAIPIGGIVKVGAGIGEFIGNTIDAAKTTWSDTTTNISGLNKLVVAGDVTGVFKYKLQKTEDNPLGWFVSATGNIVKPFYAIAAGISAIGKPIVDFLGNTFKTVGDFGKNVMTYVKSANEYTDPKKDIKGFENLKFGGGDDPASKITGAILKFVMKQWVGVVRGFRTVADNIFGFIDKAKEWVGEKVDTMVKDTENMGRDLPTGAERHNSGRGGRGGGRGINLPYFSQNDPRWKSTAYGNETMGEAGCGPDAMAMVVGGLNDRTMNPVRMANYAKQKGFRDETGTNWNFVDTAARDYNLDSNRKYKPNASFIQSELRSGKPVILSGQSQSGSDSPFTAEGHYVVATGIDVNGNVDISDPRGEQHSGKYNIQEVASNANIGWSFANKGGRGRRKRGGRGFFVRRGGRGFDDVVLGKANNNGISMSSAAPAKSKSNDPDMLNNFPFLLQGDGRWGSHPYTATGNASQTIASSGCGTTSMAMVLRSYGVSVSPIDTADWSKAHGFRTANSGTAWGFFPAIAAEYGLTCNNIGKNGTAISQALDNGFPVIASMGPGAFTNGGHFIVLCGKDTNGNIVVNDPASKDRSQRSWPLSIFLKEGKNFWAFSKNGKGSIGAVIDAGTLNMASTGTTKTEVTTTKDGAPTSALSVISSFFTQFTDKAWNGLLTGKWDSNYQWDDNYSSTSGSNTIDGTTTSGGVTPITGSNNAEKAWNFMRAEGLTKEGTAGLLGNMEAESGINPMNLQNSYNKSLGMTDEQYTNAIDNGSYNNFVHDKAGYGLVQWTYHSLKQQLLDYKKKTGKSIGDMGMQLELLANQLQTSYPDVWNTLKSTNDIQAASNSVLLKFERPKDQSVAMQTKRGNMSRGYYEKYKDLADTKLADATTTDNTSTTGGSGGGRGEINAGNTVEGPGTRFAEINPIYTKDDKLVNTAFGSFDKHEKISQHHMNTVNGGRGTNENVIVDLLHAITGFLEKISDSTMSSDQKLNMLKNIQTTTTANVNVVGGGKGGTTTKLQPIIIAGQNEQIVGKTDRNTEIAKKLAKGF